MGAKEGKVEREKKSVRALFEENGRSGVASFKLPFTRDIIAGRRAVDGPRNGHWKWIGIIHGERRDREISAASIDDRALIDDRHSYVAVEKGMIKRGRSAGRTRR